MFQRALADPGAGACPGANEALLAGSDDALFAELDNRQAFVRDLLADERLDEWHLQTEQQFVSMKHRSRIEAKHHLVEFGTGGRAKQLLRLVLVRCATDGAVA